MASHDGGIATGWGTGWARFLLACTCVVTPAAHAASRVQVEAERIDLRGLRVDGFLASVQLDGPSPVVQVAAARIAAPAPAGELRHLKFVCPALEIRGEDLRCDSAELRGRLGELGEQKARVAFHANRTRERYDARIRDLRVAGGRGSLEVAAAGRKMRADIELTQVALEGLLRLSGNAAALPAGTTVAGRIDGRLHAAADARGLSTIDGTLRFAAAGYATPDGRNAAENLQAVLELKAANEGAARGWSLEAGAQLNGGAVYSEPVYLDFSGRPLRMALRGRVDVGATRMLAEHFSLEHQGVARLAGAGELTRGTASPLRKLRLELQDLDMAAAAPAYLQPLLITTDFKDLQAIGRVRGHIDLDEGAVSRVALDFDHITIDSTTGALSLAGLDGRIRWVDEARRRELALAGDSSHFNSQLQFEGARVWGIDIGGATLPFTTSERHFRLLEPVFLPIFDGGLAVQTLRVRHAGTSKMYVRFDAELKPLSLSLVAPALGLPSFEGTLAGRIPGLEVHGDTVTTNGNLEMRAFDGQVTVRDLRLKDPLGQYPQLFASIDIDGLDLAQLTSTFSFGMITGRISGRVEGLETFNWMPVALDARFYSTPGDKLPHRISQRAVANLSSIGGGSGGSVAGALQSGFLQFFKQFRYKRLGLSCRLRNDVCEMNGVEPTGSGGYYIVKGSGLPRIDVIGSQRRVAWSRLVRQLQAISTSGGPVVR